MLVKWLWGYRKLVCHQQHGERLLNILLREGISYFDLKREENGDLSFLILEKEYKILMSILDKRAVKVYSVYGRGLPFLLKTRRNRAGILVGLILYFVLIFASSFFIWDVRVTSGTETPHNEIIEMLRLQGCYEGAFIPSIDFEKLCIDFVDENRDFSWMSVNVRGTVAYVEIREKELYDEPSDTPRNLIASHDGIIEDYSVYEGKSAVKVGNVVKKGDLLVSGVVEDKEGETRLCRGRGRVVARVEATLTVTVPYKYQQLCRNGKSYEERRLKFFNIFIDLPSTSPPDKSNCCERVERSALVLFERIELPLSIESRIFYECITETESYTESEAKQVAQRLMREKFAKELPGAEIISIATQETEGESEYTLSCSIKCRMDITQPSEIIT